MSGHRSASRLASGINFGHACGPPSIDPAARAAAHHAWLTLGHAAPGELLLFTALARIEPDRARLGERLAAALAGDDTAFDDRTVDARSARPAPRLLARLRSRTVADAVQRALEAEARDPALILLTPADARWPERLDHLDEPPPMLALRGDPHALDPPSVSIVGARRAGRRALDNAQRLGRDLAEAGLAVVSGLAIGIDAAAHRGALEAAANGRTVTLAVLPTGPDRTYPPRHATLAQAIVANGALVSEFPSGGPLERRHFPIRNRLVAALSHGTVIVQAAAGSGTLTTATHVQAQNRELMVAPGVPGDPACAGGEALIQEGASVVRDALDVLACVLPAMRLERLGAALGHATDQPEDQPADEAADAPASQAVGQAVGQAVSEAGDTADDAAGHEAAEPTAGVVTHGDRPSAPDGASERLLLALDGDSAGIDELAARAALTAPEALGALARLELAGLAERHADGGYSRCLTPGGGGAARRSTEPPRPCSADARDGHEDGTGLDARPCFELD